MVFYHSNRKQLIQWKKTLATKPDKPGSILRTHKVEGEKQCQCQ